ncbi:MAG: hypothetical protein WDZ93_01470 [Candidatus Paceibacterota bacterium]
MVLQIFERITYMCVGAIIAMVAFGLYVHTNKQNVARIVQQSTVSPDHCIEPDTVLHEDAADTREIFFAGCAGFF